MTVLDERSRPLALHKQRRRAKRRYKEVVNTIPAIWSLHLFCQSTLGQPAPVMEKLSSLWRSKLISDVTLCTDQ
ncbi:hypothetical protein Ciccas_010926 [Cichlidogyrus casuarinus]|uniref:Uncharacterized protein n=1 Tax=Cichlidogyrus casuarinus TaxID=1844966 RepID=A0ABD2PTJ7_9PLAT